MLSVRSGGNLRQRTPGCAAVPRRECARSGAQRSQGVVFQERLLERPDTLERNVGERAYNDEIRIWLVQVLHQLFNQGAKRGVVLGLFGSRLGMHPLSSRSPMLTSGSPP